MAKENEHLHKSTLAYKSQMHAEQKEYEMQTKVNTDKRNPFIAKINQHAKDQNAKMKSRQMLDDDYEGIHTGFEVDLG